MLGLVLLFDPTMTKQQEWDHILFHTAAMEYTSSGQVTYMCSSHLESDGLREIQPGGSGGVMCKDGGHGRMPL